MGNKPSGNGSDSDEEEEYDTPPETLESDNNLEEENNDPNVPENSADEISDNENNEILFCHHFQYSLHNFTQTSQLPPV